LPGIIRTWIKDRNWGIHHLEWHASRQWDTLSPDLRAWAQQRGWQRAAPQEGAAGNGFQFLLMHRAMLETLREQFPKDTALFEGWTTPPTEPDDANDPVPAGQPHPFDPSMLQAIHKLQTDPGSFADDDSLGLYIQTSRRPTPTNPFAGSSDPTTGIHNYIHVRFSDPNSPVNIGDPSVNLENARFWRLHGWIDQRWTAFRQAKGLSDNDPAFRHALDMEKQHMAGQAMPMAAMGLRAAARAATMPPQVPASLRSPFAEPLVQRFQRLMTTIPEISTLAELQEYLQTAIALEHYTLPPYLCAMWSLKDGAGSNDQITEILLEIVWQEMLHMALACNLLKAAGGHPRINTAVPVFPDYLPGVQLSQPVDLRPISKERVDLFMQIEKPLHPIPPMLAAAALVPKYPTIGEFYKAIDAGLVKVNPTFSADGQLAIGIGTDELVVIDSLDKARQAIQRIQEQGEGTTASQGAVDFGNGLAHYYRFQQIALERTYDPQPDNTFKLHATVNLPFPAATDIYPMATVPDVGYPGVAAAGAFDQAYTDMVNLLQQAWDTGTLQPLRDAVKIMRRLRGLAVVLMNQERPDHQGNYGPAFRYLPSTPSSPAPPAAPHSASALLQAAGPAASVTTHISGFARIQQILNEAVNNEDIGAHGPFWRNLSRDQFVAKSIFGRKLIATRPDGTFDPDESNLVKALEGRAPFGANLTPPPAGAIFNRMPDGFPPVAADRIAEIRAWIGAGCPDAAPLSPAAWMDPNAGGPAPPQQHIDYWRDFDSWAMFDATQAVQDDIDVFFRAAPLWLAFAKDATKEAAWQQALAQPNLQQALGCLETKQRDTVTTHYGKPVPLLTLLDSLERFGDDSLPDDPLRPADVRHNMNGAVMWFFWSAFADACLRLAATSSAIPDDFWRGTSRAIMLGAINDGLFRGRFKVTGFTANPAGKVAARQHVRNLQDAEIQAALALRYRESGL
jgi:hypothetical protein